MAISKESFAGNASHAFREAVCIDTRRIFDACSDKDCIRAIQVLFPDAAQSIIDNATSVKPRGVEVIGVCFEVEPLTFHKGFYTVDMTYFFKVAVSVYHAPCPTPITVYGLAIFCKKVILFGSEASVRTFSTLHAPDAPKSNLPIVNVQTIDPLILASNVCDCCEAHPSTYAPPHNIAEEFEGSFVGVTPKRSLCLTLGLFSIVQLERQVQIMIPVYDFCIPDKECNPSATEDDPCELFRKIAFPTDEFCPPRLCDIEKS